MFVHTAPREIAARWIKPGDEVATYEVEDGSGEADSGLRNFCRTEEFVTRFSSPDWWLVVDGARLVPPPADDELNRVGGSVKHYIGGRFGVEPMDRGFVPDDLDYVGASSFVLVPIRNSRLGEPRVYFAKPEEQFVIRERVKVGPRTLRLLNPPKEQTEGQRVSAGSTVAEPTPGHEDCDLDRTCSGGPYKCLQDPTWNDSAGATVAEIDAAKFSANPWTRAAAQAYEDANDPAPGTLPKWRCAVIESHPGHTWYDTKHTPGRGNPYRCDGRNAGPGIPLGVMGRSLGRDVPESDAVNFASERESLDR